MIRLKTISLYLGILIFFYVITNVFDGFLCLVQYPVLILIASKRIYKIHFDENDVLLSLFSDYLNDFYFGISLLLFLIFKIVFNKYVSLFHPKNYNIFIGKLGILLFFLGSIFFYYNNTNIDLLLQMFLINGIAMLLLNFIWEKYFV